MKFEMPRPEQFTPASETEQDIPERLKRLHEIEAKFLGRGVFFDAYSIDLPDEAGDPEPHVFKDFRSGEATMTPEEQVSLFQHQYYEWARLRQLVGEKFFPQSYWIRSDEFSEDEAHGFYSVPGKTANTMQEVIKVELDRQLTDRYGGDDQKKKSAFKSLMGKIGETLLPKHEKKPFIGAIIQKRVNGVPLGEALQRLATDDPAREEFRSQVRELLRGLRSYHEDNPYGAFTWHSLESDNVAAEVDAEGRPTGKIQVLDANFTERPNQAYREKVLKKLEQGVFQKLEEALDL